MNSTSLEPDIAIKPATGNPSTVTVNRLILVLSWLGLFIAAYLTMASIMSRVVPCLGSGGCTLVTNHPAGKWMGIPVSAFGLATYFILGGLAVIRGVMGLRQNSALVLVGTILSGFGTIASMYLMYVAFFVIAQLCTWCLTSAITMVTLFLMHAWLLQADLSDSRAPIVERNICLVALFVCAGGLGFGFNQLNAADRLAPPINDQLASQDPVTLVGGPQFFKGPVDAPITIVEFADFLCPACRTSYPLAAQTYAKYPNKIRWGYANFPMYKLSGHEMSIKVAAASLIAAEKGRYWEAVDRLFTTPEEQLKTLPGILNAISEVGIDTNEVRERLANADDKLIDAIADTQARALKAGIDRTPVFIVFAKNQKPKVVEHSLDQTLSEPQYQSLLKTNDAK